MKGNSEKRIRKEVAVRTIQIAEYIVNTGATIREASKKFNISKSIVHKNIETVLREEDLILYRRVRKVLDKNKAERALRGGKATQAKYANMKR